MFRLNRAFFTLPLAPTRCYSDSAAAASNLKLPPGLSLVDFWATWCGPCRVLTPVLTKISQEKNISLIKIDIDDNQDLAIEYKVAAVPTVVLFKDGKEVTRFVGVKPEQEILKLISKYQ
ncbi:hypothetical protein MP638_002726 [Amoeboaphelidium occidentale]|nr:hypothetical protein MP638_002726 [Amoeboaphelidium occidentale]